jgi:hypothetical protein
MICKHLWLTGSLASAAVKHAACSIEDAVGLAGTGADHVTGALIGTVKTLSCQAIEGFRGVGATVTGWLPDKQVGCARGCVLVHVYGHSGLVHGLLHVCTRDQWFNMHILKLGSVEFSAGCRDDDRKISV